MSVPRLHRIALGVLLSVALLPAFPVTAPAAPGSGLAGKQAEVDRAVSDYRKSQDRLDELQRRIAGQSSRLDTLVDAQAHAQARLTRRAEIMYRTGEVSFLSVVIGASSFEDFATRWIMLTRINQEDADAIVALMLARKQVGRSADELLRLQEDAAKEAGAMQDRLARARRDLSSSQAALAEYRRRIANAKRAGAAATPRRSAARRYSDVRGSGAWKVAVASHYGSNFTGRGANGERIGPNSMMCAHKTLPFGTLIEFKYRGRTAVAKVADRGPYTHGRTFDLGPGVIKVLGFSGVHEVRYRIISR